MELENSLTFLFTQLSTAYRNGLQKSLSEIGLNSGQIFVLISLWKSDGQNQIELAKNLKLTPPTINKMVISLAANGFVESQKCGKDSRMMRVYLTTKAREIRESVEQRWLKNESDFFSILTPTERLMLLHLFERLNETVAQEAAG